MKKLIASLFAATLLAAGLVTASGATATAATAYPNPVRTVTTVQAPAKAKVHRKVRIRATVAAPTRVQGTVRIVITRHGKVVKRFRNLKPGARVAYRFGHKTTYRILAVFIPAKGSVFKGSSTVRKIRVK